MTSHPHGTILPVRAQPGARKDAILGERAGALRVSVTAAPERGRANEAIVELLSESLGLKRSAIRLIGGEMSRDKRLLIEGVAPDDLGPRLARLLLPSAGRGLDRIRPILAVDDDRNDH
jgi:hypothetical protein